MRDLDTHKVYSYCDYDEVSGLPRAYDHPGTIRVGLAVIQAADELVGHNLMKFDIPTIKRLAPGIQIKAKLLDTLLCTRLIYPDIDEEDHRRAKTGTFPSRLIGSHSLEAWGYRIGVLKGDYGKTGDWSKWSPEMQRYCIQDTAVTRALLNKIMAENYSTEAIELEHRFADIIIKMEQRGFAFNEAKAAALYGKLTQERHDIEATLQTTFPPLQVVTETPKKKLRRVKMVPFNPASRQQVGARLMALGWVPKSRTETGLPQVDEVVLESLPYPEAKPLARYFLIRKRVGQLAEGAQAWLKHVKAGRAYYSVNTNRAVTGRCGHHDFNIAQVPRVGSEYGTECRALFEASPGMVLVGADASGLELRGLAGYLAHYDNGAYATVVTTGDVHTTNQAAFGLPLGKPGRQMAKNGIYALIYGAANEKLGETLGPLDPAHETPAQQCAIPAWAINSMLKDGPVTPERKVNWRRGAYARARVENQITGYKQLIAQVSSTLKTRGWLRGLDGRRLKARSQHSALNTLLQSAGALLVKKATVIWYEAALGAGYVWGKDFALVAHVHDEIQVEARPEIAEQIGMLFLDAIREAGLFWNFPCPLAGEFKIGSNWAETH